MAYDPDSAVLTCQDLLFLPFKTTETLAKSCAKRVWLSDCSKVFKRSCARTAIASQKGASNKTGTFLPINPSTEKPQNNHDQAWNSYYPYAPANAFPSSFEFQPHSLLEPMHTDGTWCLRQRSYVSWLL